VIKTVGSKFRHTFRALKYRNYRLFYFGNGVSLIGTWMQAVAVSWLVYRLTGSPLLLGLTGFCSQIPVLILTPFSGVLADRFNKYRLLIMTQTLAMVQAAMLAVLVFAGRPQIWQILVLSSCLGIINSLDNPVRQSFVLEMVEKKEDLGNAIALNSSLVNGARLIGPSIAGVMVAALGEGICFLLNALSFIAVIYSLLIMKIRPQKTSARKQHFISEFKEGIRYAYVFRHIFIFLALLSLVGMQYAVLMPVFAREILHGGSQTLGMLMAFSGLGAVAGAIYLASKKSSSGLSGTMLISSMVLSAAITLFSFSANIYVSCMLLIFTGFGMMVTMASGNTILQTLVDDSKRGRVMSIYTIAFLGMAPLGSIMIGGLANLIGAPHAMLVCGIFAFMTAAVFGLNLPSFRETVRPLRAETLRAREAAAIQSVDSLTSPPEAQA